MVLGTCLAVFIAGSVSESFFLPSEVPPPCHSCSLGLRWEEETLLETL